MLTIGRLARYAGVTVRAVRHYHQVGLLPEPERDRSGYRAYGPADVVRLIRIRTLADAGVPLARVQELLDAGPQEFHDAGPQEFHDAVQEIRARLAAVIRRLEDARRRLALLADGDHLALPESVSGYLDRVRAMGVDERYLRMERDSWIMLAAQVPDRVDAMIASKHAELDDPDAVRLYRLLSGALDWPPDDPRVVEVVDLLERLMRRGLEAGTAGPDGIDDQVVELLDAATLEYSPLAERILAMLHERGWRGWTRIERAPDPSDGGGSRVPPPSDRS